MTDLEIAIQAAKETIDLAGAMTSAQLEAAGPELEQLLASSRIVLLYADLKFRYDVLKSEHAMLSDAHERLRIEHLDPRPEAVWPLQETHAPIAYRIDSLPKSRR